MKLDLFNPAELICSPSKTSSKNCHNLGQPNSTYGGLIVGNKKHHHNRQSWKKFLAFWASELVNPNPSANFLRNISYKEGILKICNHYSIIQK
jgi:hypothetical protein